MYGLFGDYVDRQFFSWLQKKDKILKELYFILIDICGYW